MPKSRKTKLSEAVREGRKVLEEADKMLQQLTGKSTREYVRELIRGTVEDLHRQVVEERPKVDPYQALGVSRDADQESVRAVYRLLVKIFHEGGSAPNSGKMKEVNLAYEAIRKERHWPK